jgi:hypothetical protein
MQDEDFFAPKWSYGKFDTTTEDLASNPNGNRRVIPTESVAYAHRDERISGVAIRRCIDHALRLS